MGSTEKVLSVAPDLIQAGADDNSRFGLKQSRVDSIAASILEKGGVLTPLWVEPLDPPANGKEYRLIAGFIRLAAVEKLNREGAGLEVPVLIKSPEDDKARLALQLTENMERENQSPMDMAVAIQKLIDNGMERKDIRRIFSRPSGKKGNQVQPASNSWLNITLSLLELPKSIQQKIHEGAIGFAAAYELGKVDPEKRQAVIDRAEADRVKQVETEEKDEEKFLKAEQGALAAEAKLTEHQSEEETLRAGVKAAEESKKAAVEAFRTLQKADYLNFPEKEKVEHRKRLTESEGAVKAAEKADKDAKNKLAKILERKGKVQEAAEAARQRLEEAKSAKLRAKADKGRQKGEAVGPTDVKKAAAAEGAGTGYVALSASEMRGVIKEIAGQKAAPKVAAIGAVMTRIFSGELTTQAGSKELAFLTGELKRPDPKKPTGKTPSMTAGAPAA